MDTTSEAAKNIMACPITGETMTDPVIDHEGNSYERSAIEEWLTKNETSPITRNPLKLDQLSPNRALKDLIEQMERKATTEQPKKKDEEVTIDQIKDLTEKMELSTKTTEKRKNEEELATIDPPPSPQIELFQTEIDKKTGKGIVSIHVSEDDDERHKPSKIVCAIDVSYSMDDAATMHNDTEGSSGLSLLDIVKHATVTLIESMSSADEIAVVSYATKAKVVLPLTKMTSSGKTKAKRSVESLKTEGTTNLWDGLLKSMELVNASNTATKDQNSNIFLLTDGRPNVNPPRGELQTFIRYKEKNTAGDNIAKVSTFGFGYNLDSKLLNDIAIAGNGHYCFIPDSSFVGTVFINAAANVLSSAIPSATLSIEGEDIVDDSFFLVDNDQSCTKTSWGATISLPSLSYGQTLDIAIQVDPKKIKEESPLFNISIKSDTIANDDVPVALVNDITEQICLGEIRAKIVSFIRTSELRFKNNQATEAAMKSAEEDRLKLLALANSYTKKMISNTNKQYLEALIADIDGQIAEAYSKDSWHSKWGKHYLLSLARAHELQQCTNFKDPGVQTYATKKFSLIRDTAEDKFCSLPPPKPSLRINRSQNTTTSVNMSSYHNSSAPCFAAGTPVCLAPDGRYVPVEKIMAGDRIFGGAIVRCVIVTECDDNGADLVELEDGIRVTPWHPVRHHHCVDKRDNSWKFPADLGSIKRDPDCRWVYSFVLDSIHTMQLGSSYEAVTLGHGIMGDAVATHPYLGTSDVIRDLSEMNGWEEGRLYLGPNPGIRCPKSKVIVKFIQRQEEKGDGKPKMQQQQISQKSLTVW